MSNRLHMRYEVNRLKEIGLCRINTKTQCAAQWPGLPSSWDRLFFGLLMSFVAVFFIMVYNVFLMDEEFLLSGKWIHMLWILPLAWGALGVFFVDKMLELARDIF